MTATLTAHPANVDRTAPNDDQREAADPQGDATMSLSALQQKLHCTPDGLTAEGVRDRRQHWGYNELPAESVNPILKFLSYFWGPIPWMIEGAVALSAVVGHWADFGVILTLLVVNAMVGFWEEFQAGNAIAALRSKLALKARVRRDGAWATLPARELVPGDVIRIRLGDVVPADAKLLPGDPVEVDQSALTGESLPVTRGESDAVYSGSIIKVGEADALVYGTGLNTYFGNTAKLVAAGHRTSHFQRAILKIGNFLIVIALALVALILAVTLYRGDPLLETLQFALVLTVAAIPVAMPTVLSVTMAVGARLLARREAIVTRLASIEELSGMDVLCSDKTGTLTQNKLTLGDPFLLDGVTTDDILLAAALASRGEDDDAIDRAVLNKSGDLASQSNLHVTHFQPFDPVHKRTEATARNEQGNEFRTTKGAPQVIVALLADPAEVQQQVDDAIAQFAVHGYRALGVARTDEAGEWRLLGILPLYDPPREDSKETIAQARAMGCQVKMVTGDQLAIGREIAGQLDLGDQLADASVLEKSTQDDAARVDDVIENADGFAQVYPEHKFRIVEALQSHGHIVGMTGDGVNDAPALKEADCGIAVSGATDAARAAADIVLLTPGLSVIIDAVQEARKIFERMNSYAIYRIAETIRVLLFMSLSILVFNFYPVTAVMIVLLALLNDGAILSIAYDRVSPSESPQRWNMPRVLGIASVLGLVGVVYSFGLFYIAERVFHLHRDVIQSLIYLKLSVAGHLTIFLTRTRGPFWSSRPARVLVAAVVGTQIVATLIAVYGVFMEPLGWTAAGLVWLYALASFLLTDRIKLVAYRLLERRERSESATASQQA